MVYEKKKTDGKSSRGEFLKKVLALPHIEAIISDSFWYIICIFFKGPDKKYSEKKEMLLDRLAANFVSFFIRYRTKKGFIFTTFYDLIAQAVFFSLFFAYPKSRTKFDINIIFKLLKEFAGLFNGPRIRTPALSLIKHWTLDLGTGNIIESLRQSIGD